MPDDDKPVTKPPKRKFTPRAKPAPNPWLDDDEELENIEFLPQVEALLKGQPASEPQDAIDALDFNQAGAGVPDWMTKPTPEPVAKKVRKVPPPVPPHLFKGQKTFQQLAEDMAKNFSPVGGVTTGGKTIFGLPVVIDASIPPGEVQFVPTPKARKAVPMTLDEFIVLKGGVDQAMIKARNMRFSGMMYRECSPGTVIERDHIHMLNDGRACFKCVKCANALMSILAVMIDQQARNVEEPMNDAELAEWLADHPRPGSTADGLPAVTKVDKFGLKTVAFKVPVKKGNP